MNNNFTIEYVDKNGKILLGKCMIDKGVLRISRLQESS